jgi:hypothetical protein
MLCLCSLAWPSELVRSMYMYTCMHLFQQHLNIHVTLHVTLTPNPESESPERQDADLIRGTVWSLPKVRLLDHSPCQVYFLPPYTPARIS